MRLDNIKQPKTDGFNVFASLPDMGKVGGLVSAYLAKNLKSECIAVIASNEKPWVSYTDGVVKTVSDLYQLYYDAEHNLLIFTGNSQPQDPTELYQLCKSFLDHIQTIGIIRRLYSAGGYLRQHLTGAPMVSGGRKQSWTKTSTAKFRYRHTRPGNKHYNMVQRINFGLGCR